MSKKLEPFQIRNKWGYQDEKCQEVIEAKFDYARSFSEGIAAVKIGEKWGYINESAGEVIPF
jgi:hypothetical protein